MTHPSQETLNIALNETAKAIRIHFPLACLEDVYLHQNFLNKLFDHIGPENYTSLQEVTYQGLGSRHGIIVSFKKVDPKEFHINEVLDNWCTYLKKRNMDLEFNTQRTMSDNRVLTRKLRHASEYSQLLSWTVSLLGMLIIALLFLKLH